MKYNYIKIIVDFIFGHRDFYIAKNQGVKSGHPIIFGHPNNMHKK